MNDTIRKAKSLIEDAALKRAEQQWGEAINIYMECIHELDSFTSDSPDDMQEASRLRELASASIEYIYDIRSFVNVDLMNP